MSEYSLYVTAGTWAGGFYELAVELGPRSNERLNAALLALWQHPQLQGCYLHRDIEPADQPRIEPSLALLEAQGHLLGVATLPNGVRVACGVVAIQEEDGSDWLDFYLPMGALSTAYDVGAFPFDDGKDTRHWRETLDGWLVELAQSVYEVTPFPLALIGHEVCGEVNAADITMHGIPSQRWDGYLWQEDGSLLWYPPTNYGALITTAT